MSKKFKKEVIKIKVNNNNSINKIVKLKLLKVLTRSLGSKGLVNLS